MIETMLITVLLAVIGFATIQLIIVVITDMRCDEAGFAAARVAMVSDQNNMNRKVSFALGYLLSEQLSTGQLLFKSLPKANPVAVQGTTRNDPEIRDITIKYSEKVIFGSLFNPSGINKGYVSRTSNSRIVISPDSAYYHKGYPGASDLGVNLPTDVGAL